MHNLRPTVSGQLRCVIDNPRILFESTDSYGGPIVVTDGSTAVKACKEFQDTAIRHGIQMRIFAAHKATNSSSAIRSLVGSAGIDVASQQELDDALCFGFDASDIIATGPKNNAFLKSLIDNHITIAVDSAEECKRIAECMDRDQSCDILIRLSRSILNLPGVTRKSRFGVDRKGLDRIISHAQFDRRLRIKGVSFHIDTVSIEEKIHAAGVACEEAMKLRDIGFNIESIDIGGGFGAYYGVDKKQIDDYIITSQQVPATQVSWQGSGSIGLESNVPQLFGAMSLNAIFEGYYKGQRIAEVFRENLFELWIEPGSSLFAATSITAAQVIETRILDDEKIALVDIQRNQLHFNDIEIPADPLLVKRRGTRHAAATSCTLFGRLCLESDILSYRKITFDQEPEPGDLIVWVHTGAYRSYFNASGAIGHLRVKRFFVNEIKGKYVLEEDV